MRALSLSTALLALATAMPAIAQDAIQVDGSSTVFPVSEAFAEEFQAATGNRVVVGVSGTGGGFQKFCRGEISFAGASRPIRTSEMEACAAAGIEYVELPIAIDALAVVINPANTFAQCLSIAELNTMWEPAAQGVVNNWNQVNAAFPDAPLTLFGPGTDSGTYDYFTFAVTGEEHSSRGDFSASEDDNVLVQGVSTDPNALGFFGLAYLDENRERLQAVGIRQEDGSCVEPSTETAANGTYQPLTRPLFIYVNAAHLDSMPAVQDYAMFMMNGELAPELVAETGYLPLPAEAFALAQSKITNRVTGTYFGGSSRTGVSVADLLAH